MHSHPPVIIVELVHAQARLRRISAGSLIRRGEGRLIVASALCTQTTRSDHMPLHKSVLPFPQKWTTFRQEYAVLEGT